MKVKKISKIIFISLFFLSCNRENEFYEYSKENKFYEYNSENQFYKLDDEKISYDELLSHSPYTILFLWASSCSYCLIELKKANRRKESFKDVQFYYVNLGENKYTVEKAVELLKLSLNIKKNIVLDREGILIKEFNIVSIPTYLFLKDGNLLYKTHFINRSLIEEIFKKDE
mgnify:CR=1 FL=1